MRDPLDIHPPEGTPVVLAPPDLDLYLASLPEWALHGRSLTRTLRFADFSAALSFVNLLGDLAEQLQHHPDLSLRWGVVDVALTTHEAGGVTLRDIAFAQAVDALGAPR